MRPCTCDRIPPEGEAWSKGFCVPCTLYHRKAHYREKWDTPAPQPVERKGPGLVQKAKNFAIAAAKFLAAGSPVVSEPEVQARVAICEGCTEYFDATARACKHKKCGCKVDRKAPWATEHCPLGKW